MAPRKHRKSHDVKQTEKVLPLMTGEIAFRQHNCELVFGINTFVLDFWSPSFSCQTTYHVQLCGFGTRVSSDFDLQ